MKTSHRQFFLHLGLGALSLVLAVTVLAAAEIHLRRYYRVPPPYNFVFSPREVMIKGFFRRSRVPRANDPSPRIFCIGGSSTHGHLVASRASYPALLQVLLDEGGVPATVYNFGIPGASSYGSSSVIRNIIPRFKPDFVVIHDGYNDLPAVTRKLGDDLYGFFRFDYRTGFDPYIRNPLMEYVVSFIRYNFCGFRTLFFARRNGDGGLASGIYQLNLKELKGSSEEILRENQLRAYEFVLNEFAAIQYCLDHKIKVIVVLEPRIRPNFHDPYWHTAFADERIGELLRSCHEKQQEFFYQCLKEKFPRNLDFQILDLRQTFRENPENYMYDECHLNATGNGVVAMDLMRLIIAMQQLEEKENAQKTDRI